MAAIVPTRL